MDRPILFSGPMVRAIHEGRKTQTRRLVGLRQLQESGTPGYDWTFRGRAPIRSIAQQQRRKGGCWQDLTTAELLALCPYGEPGDRLWVRETFCLRDPEHHPERGYWYAATDDVDEPRWSPSIHMPRAASRITILITDVRVQRLQEIDEDDARAEGLHWWSKDGELRKWGLAERHVSGELDHVEPWAEMAHSHTEAFGLLWDSINGKRATWASNPWVWALSFEVTNG